jgi:hypothetical protein
MEAVYLQRYTKVPCPEVHFVKQTAFRGMTYKINFVEIKPDKTRRDWTRRDETRLDETRQDKQFSSPDRIERPDMDFSYREIEKPKLSQIEIKKWLDV